MSELESIIDDVGNQVAKRQTGCLSMRSERMLVDEIKALRVKAEYWRLLAERCDHDRDGKIIEMDDGYSFSCSKCGGLS